jgi:hypothetical protein
MGADHVSSGARIRCHDLGALSFALASGTPLQEAQIAFAYLRFADPGWPNSQKLDLGAAASSRDSPENFSLRLLLPHGDSRAQKAYATGSPWFRFRTALWALRTAVPFIGAWSVMADEHFLQKLANSPRKHKLAMTQCFTL